VQVRWCDGGCTRRRSSQQVSAGHTTSKQTVHSSDSRLGITRERSSFGHMGEAYYNPADTIIGTAHHGATGTISGVTGSTRQPNTLLHSCAPERLYPGAAPWHVHLPLRLMRKDCNLQPALYAYLVHNC
jgi:hypothetical protein